MQIEVKKSFYQSFGGINFLENDFNYLGLARLINRHLGQRNPNAAYSYADVLKSLWLMFSIGGEVLDDLNVLREQLKDHPWFTPCSPDTVEYVCRELKPPIKEVITDKAVKHQLCEHEGFNRLLPALALQGELLSTTQPYTLDYDGHIVENAKPDSLQNYKHTCSYYPVMFSILKLPVYLQNRNGNTPEQYGQLELLKKAVDQCRSLGLQLKKFRADASCYEKDTIDWLELNDFTYYIRAEFHEMLHMALQDEPDWQPVLLNNRKVEVCAVEEKLFGDGVIRRIVAYREKVKGQLSLQDMNGYCYHGVITNDTADPLTCIEFYNQRGCEGEHHFKELDYDFGWNKLPFDSLAMNTIYLYSTAVAYILFNIFKHRFANKTTLVRPSMRIKSFILHFITLPAKWIKTGRQYILKLFTQKDYSLLLAT